MPYGYLAGSALGKVVADTLVSAAVGAIATGAAYALSGGSFSEGAKAGAIGGAIVGGTYSAMNQDWSGGLLGSPQSSPAPAPPGQPSSPKQGQLQAAPNQQVPVESKSGGLLDWKSWDAADKEMLGGAIGGGAKGYFAQQQAKDAQKAAALQAQNERDMFFVSPNAGANWTPRAVVPRISRTQNTQRRA